MKNGRFFLIIGLFASLSFGHDLLFAITKGQVSEQTKGVELLDAKAQEGVVGGWRNWSNHNGVLLPNYIGHQNRPPLFTQEQLQNFQKDLEKIFSKH